MKKLILETRDLKNKTSLSERKIMGMIPYNSLSERMDLEYTDEAEYEVILPTAWNKTLGDNKNVYLNLSHEDDSILASTRSGTMTLENKNDGLYFSADIADTDVGNRAYSEVARGDVPNLSFEYYVRDYYTKDGVAYIRSGELVAISLAVPYPAYRETYAQPLLNAMDRSIKQMKKLTRDLEKMGNSGNIEQKDDLSKVLAELQAEIESIKALLTSDNKVDTETETKTPDATDGNLQSEQRECASPDKKDTNQHKEENRAAETVADKTENAKVPEDKKPDNGTETPATTEKTAEEIEKEKKLAELEKELEKEMQ